MKIMIPRVTNGYRMSRLITVPVVYAPVASFAQVRACAFSEKIALSWACLVGKCLWSSASLMPAALDLVNVPVKPFATNNDVVRLSKLACRLCWRLGAVDVVDEQMSVLYSW